MARSRIFVIGVVAGVSLAFLAACNAVLGLGDYEKVDADGGAADAAVEADATHFDAPPDAVIDVEAGTYDPAHAWANWHMPNPDNDAGYPNQTTYEAGSDAGVVLDTLTQLQWENVGSSPPITSVADAQAYCTSRASTGFAGFHDWRLPTRIELVSLIDYTRASGAAIDPVFAGTPADAFWSSSPVGKPNEGKTWRVEFDKGQVLMASDGSLGRVRCVRGGKARLP